MMSVRALPSDGRDAEDAGINGSSAASVSRGRLESSGAISVVRTVRQVGAASWKRCPIGWTFARWRESGCEALVFPWWADRRVPFRGTGN